MASRFQEKHLLCPRPILLVAGRDVRDRFIRPWPTAAMGKGADVNEYAGAACRWRNKAKALVVIPFGNRAFMPHLFISGCAGRIGPSP